VQVNDFVLAGFVGKDAEDRVTQGGTRIVSFPLCHTDKGKDGRADTSTWVRVKTFGGWCDTAAAIRKGDNVMVKGKLNVSSYTDKDGKERTSVEVIAHAVGLLVREGGSGGAGQPRGDAVRTVVLAWMTFLFEERRAPLGVRLLRNYLRRCNR
jgi:single-strand DNA-binding protein